MKIPFFSTNEILVYLLPDGVSSAGRGLQPRPGRFRSYGYLNIAELQTLSGSVDI